MTNVQNTTQAHNDNRFALDSKSREVVRLVRFAIDRCDQLAELGKEAAREAWAEHAGDTSAIPAWPKPGAWSERAAATGLLENDRALNEQEGRVVWPAYWNELHVLAGIQLDVHGLPVAHTRGSSSAACARSAGGC